MENTTNKGRGKGNLNKLTYDEKTLLFHALKGEFERLNQYIYGIPETEKRVRVLLKFLPYLVAKGNPENEWENETQKVVFEALLPHYRNLKNTINLLPKEERVRVLLEFFKNLAPKQRRIVSAMLE
jgi:hypothetical protein